MMPIRFRALLPLVIALGFAADARGQEDEDAAQAAREAEFIEMLSGVELVGSFTVDDAPEGAPLQKDRYTIHKVTKLGNGFFRFDARVVYGERDVTVPIPLQVKWAGDTPLITLTDMTIPGLGTYTARVLFYRGQYAGTWSGPDHGGHMFGDIVPLEEPEPGPEAEPPAESVKEPPAKKAGKRVPAEAGQWPSFRGLGGRGISEGQTLAVDWDVKQGTGVRWERLIPGLAHSSPVIWDDVLYVTSAERVDEVEGELRIGLYGDIGSVDDEGIHQFTLYALDKNDGEILWSEVAYEGTPAIKRHPKGSHAACSPATDGQHVVAFFASEGLYCYDPDGVLLWSKDLGVLDAGFYMVPDAQWGSSSSPVIHEGKVILQCDVQESSFLAAFDVETGDELWRTARDEVPTWGTPTVHVSERRSQIICNGYKHIGGYDLETGEELWKLAGGGDIPVPTPVVVDGVDRTSRTRTVSFSPILRDCRTDAARRRCRWTPTTLRGGSCGPRPRKRQLHADAPGVRRSPVPVLGRRDHHLLRRPQRGRGVSPAPGQGPRRLHGVRRGGRWQAVLHQRGGRDLRGPGRTRVRAAGPQLHG